MATVECCEVAVAVVVVAADDIGWEYFAFDSSNRVEDSPSWRIGGVAKIKIILPPSPVNRREFLCCYGSPLKIEAEWSSATFSLNIYTPVGYQKNTAVASCCNKK